MSGLFSFIGRIFSSNARHNHELYKSGKADRGVKVETAVGWNPDPQGDGREWKRKDMGTPSGTTEYSRPAREKNYGEKRVMDWDWDETDRP